MSKLMNAILCIGWFAVAVIVFGTACGWWIVEMPLFSQFIASGALSGFYLKELLEGK